MPSWEYKGSCLVPKNKDLIHYEMLIYLLLQKKKKQPSSSTAPVRIKDSIHTANGSLWQFLELCHPELLQVQS